MSFVTDALGTIFSALWQVVKSPIGVVLLFAVGLYLARKYWEHSEPRGN